MHVTTKAWAAGFFDGEGSISIQPKLHYYLYIEIVSTEREVIDFFVSSWGAKYEEPKKSGHWKSEKQAYRAVFFGPDRKVAKEFLLDILPYLRIKRRRAEVALRWLDEIAQFDGLRARVGNRLLGIEKEWRKRMWQEMENPEGQTKEHSPTNIGRPRLF